MGKLTEGEKHKAMKEAVNDLLCLSYDYVRGEHRCYPDYFHYLIADVYVSHDCVRYIVECETNPTRSRLKAKARLIEILGEQTLGVLVIAEADYGGLEWVKGLPGIFHRVLVYNHDTRRFTRDHVL